MSAILALKGDLFAIAHQATPDSAGLWSDLIDARALTAPGAEAGPQFAPPTVSIPAQPNASALKPLKLPTSELDGAALGGVGVRGGAPEGVMPVASVAELRSDSAFTPVELPPAAASVGHDRPIYLSIGIAAAPVTDAGAVLATSAQNNAILLEMLNRGVALVEHLPEALVDLIRRGEHLDFSTPVLSPAAGLGDRPAPLPAVVPDVVALPLTPVTDVGERSARSTAEINAAISSFVAEVENLEFIVVGKQVVLYDEDIFGYFTGDMNLTSVTFTFDDGSSVSLVGSAQDLGQFSWAI